jgi:hypothetical protein
MLLRPTQREALRTALDAIRTATLSARGGSPPTTGGRSGAGRRG